MTIQETAAATDGILDAVDQQVRQLQQEGVEPRYVVVGPVAYEALRQAIAARFNRSAGTFETYQYLAIVLDPFRDEEVCVLPAPGALVDGVRTVRV
ncbi:MAG: family 4C encapsulin nanocompartment shell protein [Rhodothermales bacterium]|nr:family 4C encapsulin nanocompartment shell protein [Rhodothermales bacterium]